MEKHITISSLIAKLKLEINFASVEMVDYWEADLCAIGLRKANRLIYISTFNYLENAKLSYDFDLEIINESNDEKLNVIRAGRNVSEEMLVGEIKSFLEA